MNRIKTVWKKKNTHKDRTITEKVGICYIYMMVFLFPLIFHNYFFDITKTKYLFFAIITVVFFSVMLLSIITRDDFAESLYSFTKRSKTDILVICWVLLNIVSCILSVDVSLSISGEEARWQGLLCMFLYALAYLIISRTKRLDDAIIWAAMAAGTLAAGLAVVNHYGIDPIGFYSSMKTEQIPKFISTLGNINIFSGYMCMMVMGAFALFLFEKKLKNEVIWGSLLFLFTFGLLAANSDSSYMGILTGGILLFILAWKSKTALPRFFSGVGIITAVLVLYGVLQNVFSGYAVEVSGITATLLAYKLYLIPVMLISFLLWGFLRYVGGNADGKENVGKYIRISGIVSVLFAVSILVWICCREEMSSFFQFDDHWGTNRGYVWSRLVRIFRGFGWSEMLFGAGQGTILELMTEHYYEEMKQVTNSVYDTAHNEYLQYLVTTGVAGLFSYCSVLISVLAGGLRRVKQLLQDERGIFIVFAAAAVVSYAGQAFFSLAQPITTPLLFVFLGWIESVRREE